MKTNIALANFIIAGVVTVGLLTHFPYAAWVIIDLGIIITCVTCGLKLLKKG